MSRIDGRAKKYNGGAIDYAMLFDWETGSCIGTSKPDAAGNWRYYYFSNLNCGITYVADGCEPITHGAYQFAHVERAPFVDFIGSVTPAGRESTSAAIPLVIPSNVVAGDMLVVGIMRRGAVSVGDDNSGAWVVGADVFGSPTTFEQGTSIYYRVAKSGDAGKTISVQSAYSGRLTAYLSIYRGKYKQLKVVNAVASPVRYDDTYSASTKNLAPIEHDGGFIVRAVSYVYATPPPDNYAEIIGMSNIGPIKATQVTKELRLQVGYKYSSSADILKSKLKTLPDTDNRGSVGDIVADVAIILDEV